MNHGNEASSSNFKKMAAKKSQKALLQKLDDYHDYGDTFLKEENQTNKTKKSKKNDNKCSKTELELEDPLNQNLHVTPIKNRKKKLNKRQRKLIKKQQNGDIEKPKKKTPLSKKMKWLKEALGSDGSFDIQPSRNITTEEEQEEKTSQKRKREPEVIVFEDPTRRKKKVENEAEKSRSDNSNDFDMRTARFEVRKLGISGFAGEKKSDARVSLLINLGAKPSQKKTYVNYKEFQRQRKSDLDAEKQRRQEEQVPGEKSTKKKSKKGQRSKSDIGIDGQIGHYKDGVQFISKDTLKKLKAS